MLSLPLSTHLAETLEELQFVDSATGALAEMIKRIGVWDETITGCGQHPIDLLAKVLGSAPPPGCVVAHLNYVDDRHLAMLAQWPISVAYCPRASAYFGHPHESHTPHLYREMLAAGINVALGTDSILCLDTPDRISVLDEMRFLFRRDGVDPVTLLRMATTNGALALGQNPQRFTLDPGPIAGLLVVPIVNRDKRHPLREMLLGVASPQWLAVPHQPTDL